MIKFKTKIGLLKHLPGMRYIEIPSAIVKKLGGKFSKRVICEVNGKVKFQGGLVALGQGKAYIAITQKRLKAAGADISSTVEVELVADKSKYGAPLCDELKEVLKQDPEARVRFEKLTPGKQRYIIQYVASVKNPDLRIERALKIFDNLKLLPVGKESFREMLGLGKRIL